MPKAPCASGAGLQQAAILQDFNSSVILPEGLAPLYGSFWPRKFFSARSLGAPENMVCIPFSSGGDEQTDNQTDNWRGIR